MGEVVQLDQRPEQPLLHTVEEAAVQLRIGRTLAYTLARRYQVSGGCEGLPVIRVGNRLRVPRWALLELACNGRVVDLSELVPDETVRRSRPTRDRVTSSSADIPTSDSADRPSSSRVQSVSRVSRARRSPRPLEQLVLLPPD